MCVCPAGLLLLKNQLDDGQDLGRRSDQRSATDDVEKKENRIVAFYLVVVAIPTPIVTMSMFV